MLLPLNGDGRRRRRYLRVLVMLKREGWEIGKKRVYRCTGWKDCSCA